MVGGAVSAELVDPFATHEPALTPEEWQDIRDEVCEAPWLDPARFPELVTYAMEALRDIACGVGNPYMPSLAATQALRGMAARAKTGSFPNEPREPAWSLDASTHDALIGPEYRASTGGWPGEREAEPADSLDSERRLPR